MQELLNLVPASEQTQLKSDLRKGKVELERLVNAVDSFYEQLGNRNWIFSSDLNVDAIEKIIAINDPDEAEQKLIAYYQSYDNVKFGVRRLTRFDAMKPRMPLVRLALEDHKHARHYSVVLALIAVMDGFVNDFDKQARKGLHARGPEELFAWDSIVGHHKGLTNAHKAFTRSFKKTSTEEVHELHRHGIMHGMLTNFNNAFVSAKAWNHLFAIGDWAEANIKEVEKAETPPEPSLDEILQQYQKLQDDKVRRDQFRPYDCSPNNSLCSALLTAEKYFGQWGKRQWGLVGSHFMQFAGQQPSVGQVAVDAKGLYEDYSLDDFSVQKVEHFGSMTAHLYASLTVNGQNHSIKQRWIHVDDGFDMVDEWEDGRWVLAPYGPLTFLNNGAG